MRFPDATDRAGACRSPAPSDQPSMGRLGRRVGQRRRDHTLGHLRAVPRNPRGRVLSRRKPSTPSSMNRCCQRQTQVFDVPVMAHDLVGFPRRRHSRSTMFARQTCFCEALRSLAIASSHWRFGRVILMEIPVRMRKTRARAKQMESESYVRQRPLASPGGD